MHIPDRILSTPICLAAAIPSAIAIGISLRKLSGTLGHRTIPFTGMVAALVFAGQMVNFPLPGLPVSGHLLGGVLASALVGPWGGCLALSLVLIIQCLMFGDGGLLALGPNILHMAVIGSLGGYTLAASLQKLIPNPSLAKRLAVPLAAGLSVMAAAAIFCLEFFLSWRSSTAADYNFSRLFTLMIAYHALIALGEAIITSLVLNTVALHRPDFLVLSSARPTSSTFVTAGVVASLAIAAFLAPFASQYDDGLEAVAARIGFDNLPPEQTPSLLSDYALPLPERWQFLSTSLAGVSGVLVIVLLSWGLTRLWKSSSPSPPPQDTPEYSTP